MPRAKKKAVSAAPKPKLGTKAKTPPARSTSSSSGGSSSAAAAAGPTTDTDLCSAIKLRLEDATCAVGVDAAASALLADAGRTGTGLVQLYLKHSTGVEFADPSAVASLACEALTTLAVGHRNYGYDPNYLEDESEADERYEKDMAALESVLHYIKKDVIGRAAEAIRNGQLLFALVFVVELCMLWPQVDLKPAYNDGGGFDELLLIDINRLTKMMVLGVAGAAVPALKSADNAWVRRWWLHAFDEMTAEDNAKHRAFNVLGIAKHPTRCEPPDDNSDYGGPFWGVPDALRLMNTVGAEDELAGFLKSNDMNFKTRDWLDFCVMG